MKTLDLVLAAKWYDMIAFGEKREEYREIKPYWEKRLQCQPNFTCGIRQVCRQVRETGAACDRFVYVRFRRGYTATAMTFQIENIATGKGKPQWGAPDHDVFIIKLGRRINTTEN